MEDGLKQMLNQECPQCKSTSGDISSYMPIVTGDNIEIEITCDNCGCYGKFIGTIDVLEFKPNV